MNHTYALIVVLISVLILIFPYRLTSTNEKSGTDQYQMDFTINYAPDHHQKESDVMAESLKEDSVLETDLQLENWMVDLSAWQALSTEVGNSKTLNSLK